MKIFIKRIFKKGQYRIIGTDEEENEKLMSLDMREIYSCEIKKSKPRNYDFFKKWWKLIQYAYDRWEPSDDEIRHALSVAALQYPNLVEGISVSDCGTTLDQFRKGITILAGYSESYFSVTGELIVTARSLKFNSMTEEEFKDLYSRTIDVLINVIGTTEIELKEQELVLDILDFA